MAWETGVQSQVESYQRLKKKKKKKKKKFKTFNLKHECSWDHNPQKTPHVNTRL